MLLYSYEKHIKHISSGTTNIFLMIFAEIKNLNMLAQFSKVSIDVHPSDPQ